MAMREKKQWILNHTDGRTSQIQPPTDVKHSSATTYPPTHCCVQWKSDTFLQSIQLFLSISPFSSYSFFFSSACSLMRFSLLVIFRHPGIEAAIVAL